jgi:Ferritin-like
MSAVFYKFFTARSPMTNLITEEREIKTREDLIDALYEAAELEHSLCCLYLFAAFSFKRHPDEGNVTWAQIEKMREWEMNIFRVARQEMEHLGYVCNLLTAIGGAPHLRRPNFPTNYYDAEITFALAPFSKETLTSFVRYERPESQLNWDSGLQTKYDTIGELYHNIEKGFEKLDKRAEPLFIGPPSAQIVSQDFPGFYNRPTAYQIEINKVIDLKSAKKAIDQIIEEGEGSSRSDRKNSHHQIFENILEQLERELNADDRFQPARPVVTNPVVSPDSITHPATTATMNLFNAAYEIMLMLLIRIFSHIDETAEEVLALQRIAFFPMMTMVIRPLGEVLTQMPTTTEPDVSSTAGPNFEVARDLTLLPHKQPAWIYLHERLQELAADCQNVNHQISSLPVELHQRISPRLLQLQTNLEILAVSVYRYLNRPEKA